MNLKSFAVTSALLALTACGDQSSNPALLRGANFITKLGDTNVTLSFAQDEMRINGRIVNIYNATYTAKGNNIQFGDMMTTMMMGPTQDMMAEQEYLQFMPTVQTYELHNGRLTLKNGDGKEIVFQQVQEIPEEITEVEQVITTTPDNQ